MRMKEPNMQFSEIIMMYLNIFHIACCTNLLEYFLAPFAFLAKSFEFFFYMRLQ